MIRHSPAEKYIEYLLVHPDEYDNEAVIDLLRESQLDFVGVKYLDRLRRDLRVPVNFSPEKRFHKATSRFITKRQLYYLFYPDEHTESAFKLLKKPRAKEVIETMLITYDPAALIAHRLRGLGVRADIQTVERYRFFFFNVDLVDNTELEGLLRMRTQYIESLSDDYDDQARAAVKSAGYRDPRFAAVRQAGQNRQVASMLSAFRMGYRPTRIELSRLLDVGRMSSTAQGVLSSQEGGPVAAQSTKDWALAAKLFDEMLKDIGSPDAELQRDLQALALQTDNSQVPHIAELTGGEHTVDLQPINTREVPDE